MIMYITINTHLSCFYIYFVWSLLHNRFTGQKDFFPNNMFKDYRYTDITDMPEFFCLN